MMESWHGEAFLIKGLLWVASISYRRIPFVRGKESGAAMDISCQSEEDDEYADDLPLLWYIMTPMGRYHNKIVNALIIEKSTDDIKYKYVKTFLERFQHVYN